MTFHVIIGTVVGRSQQLPCMCNILQTADERPESFSEEKVEASGPGWGSAHQEHDRETLGDSICSQKVSCPRIAVVFSFYDVILLYLTFVTWNKASVSFWKIILQILLGGFCLGRFNSFNCLLAPIFIWLKRYLSLAVSKGFSSSTHHYKILWRNCGPWSTSFCQESPGPTLTSQ